MKIHNVDRHAEVSDPATIPTRRACLMAGVMLAAGAVVGGAGGYAIAVSHRRDGDGDGDADGDAVGDQPSNEIERMPSHDPDLEELRRLAVDAPIDELMARAVPFLSLRAHSFRDDAIGWRGVERLSREILENPKRPVAPMVIGLVMGQIEGGAPPGQPNYFDRIRALRRRREQATTR